MDLISYNNKTLLNFYTNNGLKFNADRGYFGNKVKSFAIINNEAIVGAVSISIYKNKNFIEALAVD